MNKDVLFSSKTDLWETPQDFFDMLNDVLIARSLILRAMLSDM